MDILRSIFSIFLLSQSWDGGDMRSCTHPSRAIADPTLNIQYGHSFSFHLPFVTPMNLQT